MPSVRSFNIASRLEKGDCGMVVGIVDEHGSSIVSYGKLNNGTDQEVNGDTLFEIGSITQTFTALLLQDMIKRGEMKPDDPVAKYLSKSVRMPARNGKEITLLHLAMHTSGLPGVPDNLDPKRADNRWADYTVEKLNAFLSGYKLTRDPGTKYEYSSLGMDLLDYVIALKAGTNYESLVVDRICRPLKMDGTRSTLTPELKARFATGHNQLGDAVSSSDFQALRDGAALRSTANDLLKYVSANLGLTPSSLTPLMERTHRARFHQMMDTDVGLGWTITRDLRGTKIIWQGGGASGYSTFAGFDKTQRRGVVILDSWNDGLDIPAIGRVLLASEWQSDRRPKETRISSQVYDSYVGQYQLSPSFAVDMLAMRWLLNVPKVVICIPAAFFLAVLIVLLWRAANGRKRCIILGCAALAGGLLAALIVLVWSHLICAFVPVFNIRREGDRLFTFTQTTVSSYVTGELLPESETHFFDRLTGEKLIFFLDAQGKVTRLTAHFLGYAFSYEKISDQPSKASEPLKPRVAIKPDTK